MVVEVKEILAKWPLYDASHEVSSRRINGGFWIGYRTVSGHRPHGSTHFDVNILNGVFYVLSIEIVPEHRGKGHGAALYKALEEIALKLGCHRVQMTPSGNTATGESRESYLLRRDYEKFGGEVVKHV